MLTLCQTSQTTWGQKSNAVEAQGEARAEISSRIAEPIARVPVASETSIIQPVTLFVFGQIEFKSKAKANEALTSDPG